MTGKPTKELINLSQQLIIIIEKVYLPQPRNQRRDTLDLGNKSDCALFQREGKLAFLFHSTEAIQYTMAVATRSKTTL
jgi:hypothetical protein